MGSCPHGFRSVSQSQTRKDRLGMQPEFSLCSGKQDALGVLNRWGEGKGREAEQVRGLTGLEQAVALEDRLSESE